MAEYPPRFDQIHNDTERERNREETKFLSDPVESIAVQAGKEIDQERREIDEVLEGMRTRQRYYFEKAQMHDEAASFYRRMSEDIADLLNNDFVNKGNKREKSQIIREGYGG